jgi:hypothetical protein
MVWAIMTMATMITPTRAAMAILKCNLYERFFVSRFAPQFGQQRVVLTNE